MVRTDPFYDVLFSRRSIRRFRPQPVPRAKIERLLRAAMWAASAHNRQPWRFVVLQSDARKEALAKAMGERLRRDLQADGLPAELIERDVARSYGRMCGAPVLIVVCMSMEDMDRYPDPRRQENERIMAMQSTAMAGQNLLLAAQAESLGACWMCAPLFCADVVKSHLELPEEWEPQGLIVCGYPAEQRQKTRAPLHSRVIFADEASW